MEYDRSGRSREVATVIFRKREDADLAVSQFHKRTLDGTPMNVEIMEGPAPSSRSGNTLSATASGGSGSGSGTLGGRTDMIRGRGGNVGSGGAGGMGNSWRGETRPDLKRRKSLDA